MERARRQQQGARQVAKSMQISALVQQERCAVESAVFALALTTSILSLASTDSPRAAPILNCPLWSKFLSYTAICFRRRAYNAVRELPCLEEMFVLATFKMVINQVGIAYQSCSLEITIPLPLFLPHRPPIRAQ